MSNETNVAVLSTVNLLHKRSLFDGFHLSILTFIAHWSLRFGQNRNLHNFSGLFVQPNAAKPGHFGGAYMCTVCTVHRFTTNFGSKMVSMIFVQSECVSENRSWPISTTEGSLPSPLEISLRSKSKPPLQNPGYATDIHRLCIFMQFQPLPQQIL